MAFSLRSPAFSDGAAVPVRHTCDGDDLSPHLGWEDPPEGTRSFVLIVDDPDAPSGTFTHWLLCDIPADRTELTEGQPTGSAGVAGQNDFGRVGYGGPCPPRGHGPHRYYFRLAALDVASLGVPAGAARADLERAMEGHVLGSAQIMGRYERRK